MSPPEQAQPVSLAEAYVAVASLIGLVSLSFYLFGDAGAKGPSQVALTVATDLLAEFREYERLSSTVINAALMPVMARYVERFRAEAIRRVEGPLDGNTLQYRHPAMPTGKYIEFVDRDAVVAILRDLAK